MKPPKQTGAPPGSRRTDKELTAQTTNHNATSRSNSSCPPVGAGVHSWILATANRCRNLGLSQGEAEQFIAERMTRPPSPSNEVRRAVAKAYAEKASFGYTPFTRTGVGRTPIPLDAFCFDPIKLGSVAQRITTPRNWRHWLWERSPIRPEAMNAWSFLAHLHEPGEIALVFDRIESKTPLEVIKIDLPMDCRVPPKIRAGGRYGRGVWFLSNPVDGDFHPNPRQNNQCSCRSEEAISSFRYAVLESDQAPAEQWLAFLVQLPVRISAIYSSGGRSIHCLVRLDAPTKADWDGIVGSLKRQLKVMGADPACLSAVRLTRLPQCRRPEKNSFQKLLYLCPNPLPTPLIELPILNSRRLALDHYREICPRWNPTAEAFA